MGDNFWKQQSAIRPGVFASDVSSPVAGVIFYRSDLNKLRYHNGTSFFSVADMTNSIQRDGSVTFTADQPMGSHKLTGLSAGSGAGDSVRYEQAILTSGANAFAANQPMGGFKFTGLGAGSGAGDSVRYEQVILRDGSQAFTAAQSMGGFKLTNVADPTSAQDAATKNYVDSLQYGLSWKASVRAASVANVDISSELENGDVLDGVTLATGNRVLLKDQTAPEENGIYVVVASGAASRSADMNTWSEVPAAAMFVEEGTVNGDTAWVSTADQGGTIDVDPIPFVLFASTTSFIAGNGIDISGNIISVKHDGEGLTFSGSNLALELDGSTLSKSASGVKVADNGITETQLNTSVAGSGLAGGGGTPLSVNVDNSTIEINSDTLRVKDLGISTAKIADNAVTDAKLRDSGALSVIGRSANTSGDPADISAGTDGFVLRRSGTTLGFGLLVNANIDPAAAIDYSKLNLSNSIVNADIATGAAIDAAKIADGSVSNAEFQYLANVTSDIQTQINAKVSGPASATDNAIARYDGTTGKLIQDSSSSLSDTGALAISDVFSRGDASLVNVVEEEYLHNATLTSSTSAVLAALTFDSRVYKELQIDYMVKNGNDRRGGTIYVVCNNASAVAADAVSISDGFTETADVNLSWSAAINGNNIEISYTTSTGTYRLNADLKRFMAN